jgi:hypothetical protein
LGVLDRRASSALASALRSQHRETDRCASGGVKNGTAVVTNAAAAVGVVAYDDVYADVIVVGGGGGGDVVVGSCGRGGGRGCLCFSMVIGAHDDGCGDRLFQWRQSQQWSWPTTSWVYE